MTARGPFGPRFVARFAPFALLLLLPGLAELHAPGFEHADSVGSAVAYFPAAEHPNQPRHVEPGQEAAHPECAACLHRLETRGGAPAAHTQSVAPAISGRLYDVLRALRRIGLASSARGRAPPFLLV
jgi:hypothetical protein